MTSAFDAGGAILSSRALGPGGRGIYAVTLAVVALASALACLGVPTVCRVYFGEGDELELGDYFGVALVHGGIGALSAFALTQVFVVWLLDLGTWTQSAVAAFLGFGLVLSVFMFEGLHGFGRHRRAVGSNLLGSMAAFALVVGVMTISLGADGYLLILGVSQIVQASIAWKWLHSTRPATLSYRFGVHRRLIRVGVAALPYQVSLFATFRIDRYIVGAVIGAASAGVYSVAATVSEATRVLPTSIGQVLLFGRSSGQVSRTSERHARAVIVVLTWSFLVLLFLGAPLIVETLFGPEFAAAVEPLRILLIAEGLLAIWLVNNPLLIGSRRFGAASATTMLSALVLIAADLTLIPSLGLAGAAWASVLSYGVAALSASLLLHAGERRLRLRAQA